MQWRTRYALTSYLRSAMWLTPLAGFVVSLAAIRILSWMDASLQWQWGWHLDVGVLQSVLQMFVAAMLSFIVFTFSSLFVAIQIASAQLTPRIIATTLLRDRTVRLTAALFILALVFNLGLLARTQEAVLYLPLTVALVLTLISIGAFLYLMDYAARLLRPVSIAWRLGEDGLKVIEDVYPSRIEGSHTETPARSPLAEAAREILLEGKAAIVLAVNLDTLRAEAERTGGVIEFVCRVGDFVAVGEPVFRLHGGSAYADDQRLLAAVAMGPERTIEQDATFAFRVIVDIAIKALSKAINDPTTAVLAIDQLHRLLRAAGQRHLHDDSIRDAAGNVRVVYYGPTWEDFVQLSCREIMFYGAENFQVARRLRAMLDNLALVLPKVRKPALRDELDLLDQMLTEVHRLNQNLTLAKTPDLQGLGAARR